MKPVHEATPWINSFVLVESTDKSNGKPKLQICLDPTNLNKAIIHEPYSFWTPEDIAHKLAGATVITVLDCSKGYWHQPHDDESSYLTTFNAEIGQFRFTVMPFGATVAGDVFQWKLDLIFLNLENVMIITDDIMVIGYQEDEWDHDKAFTQLLETAKIQYKQKEVEFFGETYTTQGCKPSDTKVKAITEMPKPENLKDLQIFLGMIQYLSKFSPRIAELSEPLWDLIKKHAPYSWGPEHSQAFDYIKKEIVQVPILRYYNLKKETVLQTDASIKGLGACLLQDGHPVYFASKSLQDAECGYVAIELEALAVAWAMEKFHHFLYASHFTLETDQKPLETILAKSLTEATLQLQWLLIYILPYDFTVKYIKGSTNH